MTQVTLAALGTGVAVERSGVPGIGGWLRELLRDVDRGQDLAIANASSLRMAALNRNGGKRPRSPSQLRDSASAGRGLATKTRRG
ncbi:MAG: hypothetical protein H0T87_06750 [Gammaproteobacteria bacterium]|nr:hypothetical protein [Gammaproteobacteria bacterium]